MKLNYDETYEKLNQYKPKKTGIQNFFYKRNSHKIYNSMSLSQKTKDESKRKLQLKKASTHSNNFYKPGVNELVYSPKSSINTLTDKYRGPEKNELANLKDLK